MDGDKINTYGIGSNNPNTNKLKDGDEVNVYDANPISVDTDGDGLSDGDEVNKYRTDPTDEDYDDDGVKDGDDYNPLTDLKITVNIQKIEQYYGSNQNVDPYGGEGDFYVKVWIDGTLYKSAEPIKKDDWCLDENELTNVIYTKNIDDDKRTIDIKIELWDDDTPWSADDHMDINSVGADHNLDITYDVRYGRWDGDDKIGDSDGYGFTQSYRESEWRAKMWFDITMNDNDEDEVAYWAEVNVYGTDPTKSDTDGDGLNDGAEVNVYKMEPTVRNDRYAVIVCGGAAGGN